jgi:hypothetical protein
LAKLISKERVGKELYRKIRQYQKILERAYLKKKGDYFRGKIDNKKEGELK